LSRAIVRLEQGNFSSVKSVGEGVFEYRIDFGPSGDSADANLAVFALTG
jgi:putative component of toxin-antitoxin plasmid stabilization module